jgi:hypothetical protein
VPETDDPAVVLAAVRPVTFPEVSTVPTHPYPCADEYPWLDAATTPCGTTDSFGPYSIRSGDFTPCKTFC